MTYYYLMKYGIWSQEIYNPQLKMWQAGLTPSRAQLIAIRSEAEALTKKVGGHVSEYELSDADASEVKYDAWVHEFTKGVRE